MLEFIGTLAVCVGALWTIRYLWKFWRFRKSISALELLARAIKAKGDIVASSIGSEAAQNTYVLSACFQGIANTLSTGRLAGADVAVTQLQMLSTMIDSPDDIAFYLEQPIESVTDFSNSLMQARDSFLSLYSVAGGR